jgi:signal transduction histidine kinase
MLSQLSLPGRSNRPLAERAPAAYASPPARFAHLEISQPLEALVRHTQLAGACTVGYDRQSPHQQIVFALSAQESLCPLPPLSAIADYLSQSQISLVAHPLAWDLLPNYHSVVCGFEGEVKDGEAKGDRPLTYLLVWGREPLQPWQVYMIEQQAKLFQRSTQIAQQVAQTEQYRQTLTSLKDTLDQTLRSTEHQLRTPLALIQMYADLLMAQALPEGMQDPVKRIQITLQNLEESLRRLCRGQLQAQPQRRSLDLRELFLERLESLQPWLEEKQINLSLELQSCSIRVDAWQMQQVFQNLLENALFFSPIGSTLTCRCRVFQQEVLIQISDQGKGLSTLDQQNLFQPYYSQRTGGTGLGLAIAWQVVQEHCGRIWAENLPQGGAQFSITLPR